MDLKYFLTQIIFYPLYIFAIEENFVIDLKNNYSLKYVITKTFADDDTMVLMNLKEYNDVNIKQPHVLLDEKLHGNIDTIFFVNYVIFITDIEEFTHQLAYLINSKLWNKHLSTRGKFLIVINTLKDVDNILKILLTKDIYKMLIWQMGTSCLYAVNPYKDSKRLIKTDLNEVNFEDFKPENFPVIFRRSPISYPITGDIYMNAVGIYEECMDVISKTLKLNFTHIYYNDGSYQFEYYGHQETNITNHTLYNGTIDIFQVHDSYSHFYENYDITESAYKDIQLIVFIKPGPKNNFDVFISIFSARATIMIFVVLILSTATLWSFMKYDNTNKVRDFASCFFLLLGTTFAVSSPFPSRRWFIKILIFFYSIYSLHLYNFFQGRFSSLITNPPLKYNVRNLFDLVDANLIPMISFRKVEALQGEDTPLTRKLLEKFYERAIYDNWIYYMMNHTQYAVTVYETQYFIYGNDKIKSLEICYPTYRDVRFGLRKGHPLTEHINNVIRQIVAGGLPLKWLNNVRNVTFSNFDEVKNVVLTFDHLYAGILILLAGYILSLIIFVIEIFHKTLRGKFKKIYQRFSTYFFN